MEVNGLEVNYYLSGNNIWIKIFEFEDKIPVRLDLIVINNTSSLSLQPFKLYPDPNNIFNFNISMAIRALQPEPNHLTYNTLQNFTLTFSVTYSDGTTENQIFDRYFIRGGRNKNNIQQWFLFPAEPLLIDKWVEWQGIILPGNPMRIEGNKIVDFAPSPNQIRKLLVPGNCNYKIVKFLNSLGGYQFWVFEYSQIDLKTKGKGTIAKMAQILRDDTGVSLGVDVTEMIILKSKVPQDLQPIILDLIKSPDILIYDPAGEDDKSLWEKVELTESNEATLNTMDGIYFNELTFKIPNYVNIEL